MIEAREIYDILGRCVTMDHDVQMGAVVVDGQERAANEINGLIASRAKPASSVQDAIEKLIEQAGSLGGGSGVELLRLAGALANKLDVRERALDMAIRAGRLPPSGSIVDAAKDFEAYLSGQ